MVSIKYSENEKQKHMKTVICLETGNINNLMEKVNLRHHLPLRRLAHAIYRDFTSAVIIKNIIRNFLISLIFFAQNIHGMQQCL